MQSFIYQCTARAEHFGSGIGWFVLIGITAAAVHWGVVVWLVQHFGCRPLLANVLGWLIAFSVSFLGHYRLTFGKRNLPFWRAAGRFFAVSLCGFGVNEMVYAWLLRWSVLRYDLVLAVVLMVVAGGTYIASRYWAFRHSPAS